MQFLGQIFFLHEILLKNTFCNFLQDIPSVLLVSSYLEGKDKATGSFGGHWTVWPEILSLVEDD